MTKKSKLSDVIGLYMLIAIGTAGVMGYFVIKPFLAQAKATAAKVDTVHADIASLKQLKKDTVTLRTNYDAVKEQRDAILQLLPVKSDEERLLVLLNSLALESGVVLSSFAPGGNGGTAAVPGLNIYGASINVSGNYASMQKFLSRIENSARFVDVLSLSETSGTAPSGAVPVAGAISLNAYYQGDTTGGTK